MKVGHIKQQGVNILGFVVRCVWLSPALSFPGDPTTFVNKVIPRLSKKGAEVHEIKNISPERLYQIVW